MLLLRNKFPILKLSTCKFLITKKLEVSLSKFGWFKTDVFFFKFSLLENAFFFFSSTTCFAIASSSFNSVYRALRLRRSYYVWLCGILSGYLTPFRIRFFLSGLGNRILELKKRIVLLKLGFAHNILIKCGFGIWITRYKRKNSFVLWAQRWRSIMRLLFLIRRLKKPDVYNGNGVRYVREKVKLKPRKK